MINVNEILFQPSDSSYSEKTPGYVDIGGTERIAVIQGGSASAQKAMMYFHGNGEDIGESTAAMRHFIPPDVFFVAVDYPGYGLSDGFPTEEGCYRNAHRLYQWLREDRGFAPEDILIVGFSLGTGVALELAEHCPARAVLLQAPFITGRRLIGYWVPEWERALPQNANPFPSVERIGRLTSPIAAIHGTEDDIVPFAQGEELYAAAPNKAGFTAVPAAGHNNLLAVLGPLRYRAIVESLLA